MTFDIEPEWNNLGETGGQTIGEALKVNSTLQPLDLGSNKLGETSGHAIGEALKAIESRSISEKKGGAGPRFAQLSPVHEEGDETGRGVWKV